MLQFGISLANIIYEIMLSLQSSTWQQGFIQPVFLFPYICGQCCDDTLLSIIERGFIVIKPFFPRTFRHPKINHVWVTICLDYISNDISLLAVTLNGTIMFVAIVVKAGKLLILFLSSTWMHILFSMQLWLNFY